MKPFILTFIFLTSLNSLLAQGNLQFNRVVHIIADTSFSCSNGGACVDSFLVRDIVVSPNKVLKIESLNYIVNSVYDLYFNDYPIYNSAYANNFPIWVPAGTYRLKFYRPNNPSTINFTARFNYMFSALEFNIVP